MHQQPTQVPGLAYSTFVRRLPYKPLATDDFRRGVRSMTPVVAMSMRNIAPDLPHAQNWLKFDLDSVESAAKWIDEDLPRPHFVMTNPDNGHSHYLYGLTTPVATGFSARRSPLDYLNAITLGYTQVLQADPAYAGKFCKTPTHPDWRTETYNGPLYTLSTLASALPTSLLTKKLLQAEVIGLGRNTTLFDSLRGWAYELAPAARSRGDYATWQRAVRRQAEALNTFGFPLPQSEVRATANSVAKWTWKNAHHFASSVLGGPKRSKLQSEEREDMTPQEARRRMMLGAEHANLVRRNRTFDAITQALAQLVSAGISAPPTRQVASLSGVSERSVQRYLRQQGQACTAN